MLYYFLLINITNIDYLWAKLPMMCVGTTTLVPPYMDSMTDDVMLCAKPKFAHHRLCDKPVKRCYRKVSEGCVMELAT